MASKTRIQAKAAKQKRQKRMAIGGVILLVAVLAIQVPRTMKMLDGGSSAPTPAAATSEQPGTAADPTAQPIAVAPVGDGELPDPNVAPEPADGQLTSFELFASKDPFVQQVVDTGVSLDDGSSAAPQDKPAGAKDGSASGSDSGSSGEDAGPGSVVVSVNGIESTVAVSESFPQDDPAFVLVAATGKTAKIGIAGGSLSDGSATVTLRLGKKLTLVNTVDGTRYELVLVSAS